MAQNKKNFSKKKLDKYLNVWYYLITVREEPAGDKEEITMTKTMERALDVVVRARGFEDNQTILFAHLLESGTIQESEAMELAHRVASLPFVEDDEE